ncbi:MAG: hypothetical protein JST14_00740 [Bacteroidetes bacterium]|nr:hypothetical protein [Bacteroidota bacterium]
MPAEVKGYLLIVGIGVSILLSYAGFMAYNSGHWVLALFALSWSVAIGYKTIHPPKDYVPLCEINKNEVTRISVSKGDGSYPRPCITIHARKDGGERVAYLKFSVRYQGGDEEVAKALEVFSDQDWEVVNEE